MLPLQAKHISTANESWKWTASSHFLAILENYLAALKPKVWSGNLHADNPDNKENGRFLHPLSDCDKSFLPRPLEYMDTCSSPLSNFWRRDTVNQTGNVLSKL